MLARRDPRTQGALAANKIKQHLDILVNTYTSPKANDVSALEELLGSPLPAHGLITRIILDSSAEVIDIDTGSKPTLPANIFLNAMVTSWDHYLPTSSSMSLQEITFGHKSPGVIFRLDEGS